MEETQFEVQPIPLPLLVDEHGHFLEPPPDLCPLQMIGGGMPPPDLPPAVEVDFNGGGVVPDMPLYPFHFEEIPEHHKHPLAVPVVSETKELGRPDAKAITETRLSRLKQLNSRPEEFLTEHQRDEKKRIIRLEKNRKAAAMSRRKKKAYIRNLEERGALMCEHISALEKENGRLRTRMRELANQLFEHTGHQIPEITKECMMPVPSADYLMLDSDSMPRKRTKRSRRDDDSDDELALSGTDRVKSEPPALLPLGQASPPPLQDVSTSASANITEEGSPILPMNIFETLPLHSVDCVKEENFMDDIDMPPVPLCVDNGEGSHAEAVVEVLECGRVDGII